MVCYLFFYPLFRVSKQKNSNPNHCSLRSFHNHPKLQNGPFWFRFSAATVVFSCGNCWCRACWRHNLQVFCPPRCYPDTYVSWLAPNMPGNLPGIASGRSNKENHGKKKKRDAAFSTDDPHVFFWKGVSGLPGKCENHHSSCRRPDHHHHHHYHFRTIIIIILLLGQNFETFHHAFNTKLHVYGLHMVSGWGVEGEKHGWLWFKRCAFQVVFHVLVHATLPETNIFATENRPFKRPKKETRPSSELLGVVQHLAD